MIGRGFILLALVSIALAERRIAFKNRCKEPIWISPLTSKNGPGLAGGIKRLAPNAQTVYSIPDSGWKGRFWPKTGCDGSSQNCKVGQSVPPCPAGGCQPPAETKIEFFYPPTGDTRTIYYDVSLVDGYTLPMEIIPNKQSGSCVTTNCRVSLSKCPTNDLSVGDLRVIRDGQVVQCLAPCKRWNFPAPYGKGLNEQQGDGKLLCCPTPPVTTEQCRAGPVVKTAYVKLIHSDCPTAYSYAYDDEGGLHNCQNPTDFVVNIC